MHKYHTSSEDVSSPSDGWSATLGLYLRLVKRSRHRWRIDRAAHLLRERPVLHPCLPGLLGRERYPR
eukprot:5868813-Prorocentrum_lima.AAC.1